MTVLAEPNWCHVMSSETKKHRAQSTARPVETVPDLADHFPMNRATWTIIHSAQELRIDNVTMMGEPHLDHYSVVLLCLYRAMQEFLHYYQTLNDDSVFRSSHDAKKQHFLHILAVSEKPDNGVLSHQWKHVLTENSVSARHPIGTCGGK